MAISSTSWGKGQSGNPNGRPINPDVQKFRDMLAKYETETGKSLFMHYIQKAFGDKKVLMDAMKKILPDLIKGEHTVEEIDLPDELRKAGKDFHDRLPAPKPEPGSSAPVQG